MEIPQNLVDHMVDFKFTRETFINQIKMMNNVHIELGEKPTLNKLKIDGIKVNPDNVVNLSDIHLVKIHKLFWDKL